MKFARWSLVVVAILGGVLASARWTLIAQERSARGQARAKGEAAGAAGPRVATVSIQDALVRPLDLPFDEETSLEELREYLTRTLGGQVILDRAALDRLELVPEDTVQLDLKGVRLKVGLQLVLDQVGLTFRVVPEDNLLILTDPEGSDDPNKRIMAEIKTLHREFHDIQDSLDDLRDLVEEDLGIEPDQTRRVVAAGPLGAPPAVAPSGFEARPDSGDLGSRRLMAKADAKAGDSGSLWRLADPRDPRTAVLAFLASALLFGGGRKLLQDLRARRAVAALDGDDPLPEDVEAASEHGRAGLIELFRLLGTAEKPAVRDAAGRALAVLWAKDDLIAEEEKALVRRAFAVTWRARRRYPRGLKSPIPIEAAYGLPFLVEEGPGVSPSNLVWSHRVLGAERAGLEVPSGWVKGPGLAAFEVDPADFASLGPHRLALAAKVRVVGLTDAWEIELPQIPFSFEFDPILAVDALLTTLDDARTPDFDRAVGLESSAVPEGGSRHLDLGPDLVLRDPPELVVTTPLPADLAHALAIEIDGVPGRFRAGQVVVSGQTGQGAVASRRFPLDEIVGLPADAIDRPGERKIRLVLTADPDLGWADPDVRSLWPGTITTNWTTVRVIRR